MFVSIQHRSVGVPVRPGHAGEVGVDRLHLVHAHFEVARLATSQLALFNHRFQFARTHRLHEDLVIAFALVRIRD